METRTPAPYFFRNHPQRDHNQKLRIDRALKGTRKKFALDELERRLLLSSDTMSFIAGAAAADLLLRVDDASIPQVQLIDNTTGAIVLSQALEDTFSGQDCGRITVARPPAIKSIRRIISPSIRPGHYLF